MSLAKRIALVCLTSLWLVMASHAQMRITSVFAANLSIQDHPGLPTASERAARSDWAMKENYVVVDASIFWDAVEHYDGSHEHTATCAMSAAAMPMPRIESIVPMLCASLNPQASFDRDSFISTIDTPPPRT